MGSIETPNTPAHKQAVSATIVLNRGSRGVWLGTMVCRVGDKVEQFTSDSPRVSEVTFALMKKLIESITGVESVVITPHLPRKIPNLGGD